MSTKPTTVQERQASKEAALVLQGQGVPVMTIVQRTGLSYSTVSKVLRAGLVAPLRPPGRQPGHGGLLTPEQQRSLRVVIRQRSPSAAGVQGWVWNRDAVSRLIKKRYGLQLSRRGLDNYLTAWGLGSTGKPVQPAKRCTEAVARWWSRHKKQIIKDAAQQRAKVLWLNRSASLTASLWQASMSKPRNKNLQFLSAETSRGTLFWQLLPGPTHPNNEIKFLDNLHRHLQKRLILIRSAAPIYNCSETVAHIMDSEGRFTVLPPAT